MESKSLKASWIIMLIVHCVIIIIGLIMLFVPKLFLIGEFEGFTGQQWSGFIGSNSKASSLFLLMNSQMGFYILTLGITALIITLFAYRKAEKWSWYLVLIINTMGWGGSLGFDFPKGDMKVIMMIIIFLIVSYIGLAIGAKPILKKSTS